MRPALIAVLAALAGGVTMSCGFECAYDVASRQRSPDGQYDAVIYAKSCGAMVGARYGVSLVDAGEKLEEKSDVRVFYFDPAQHGRRPTVAWSSDSGLLVTHDTGVVVITQLSVVARIPVQYRTASDTGGR